MDEWTEKDAGGVAFDSDTFFVCQTERKIPDASWVKNEKWNVLTKKQQEKNFPFAPDFLIELRSSTDSLKDLREKMFISQK